MEVVPFGWEFEENNCLEGYDDRHKDQQNFHYYYKRIYIEINYCQFRCRTSQFRMKFMILVWMFPFELFEIWISSKFSPFRISINSSCFSFKLISSKILSFSFLLTFNWSDTFLIFSIMGGTTWQMCSFFEIDSAFSENSSYCLYFSFSRSFSMEAI